MDKRFITLFLVLFVLLTGGVLGFYYFKGAPAPFVVQPQPTPTPTAQIPKDWKTYENKTIGISLAYPGDWFLYDEKTLAEDEKRQGGPCVGKSLEGETILSHENLGTCTGSAGDNWPGDFSIKHYNEKCSDYYSLLPINQYKKAMLKGYPIIIYPFTENSPGPRKIATGIDVYKDGCYHIEFNQIDNKAHYDQVFDKILATIKFLN